jgi:tripeptidyl-peptidase-1
MPIPPVQVSPADARRLDRELLSRSDPRSPLYGEWVSADTATAWTVRDADVDSVRRWLRRAGGHTATTRAPGFLEARLNVTAAERLLHTTYGLFEHQRTGRRIVRCSSPYAVPDHARVAFVSPTVRFPPPPGPAPGATGGDVASSPRRDKPPPTVGSPYWRTPAVLRRLYGLPNGTAAAGDLRVRQHVAGFNEQYFSPADVQQFLQTFAPWASGETVQRVVGFNNQTRGAQGLEASLDVETIMSMGSGCTTEFWSTPGRAPGRPEDEPFLAWLLGVSNQTDAALPHVITVSYGDDEKSIAPEYAARINAELAKLGARGASVLVASGDKGVAGDGTDTTPCTAFLPTFPASSPYVTAVGGATFPKDKASPVPYTQQDEIAWPDSGGGFSNAFGTPAWQATAVQTYQKLAAKQLPPASLWNASSRGYPDVAAQAKKFAVVVNGLTVEGVSGTSAAAPTFAGVVSLLVAARVKAGKPALGFLNPFLYQQADAFGDITAGFNPGCGTAGFAALEGWDPLTGLGTPDFPKLLAAVQNLK